MAGDHKWIDPDEVRNVAEVVLEKVLISDRGWEEWSAVLVDNAANALRESMLTKRPNHEGDDRDHASFRAMMLRSHVQQIVTFGLCFLTVIDREYGEGIAKIELSRDQPLKEMQPGQRYIIDRYSGLTLEEKQNHGK
jgi:hypothetical protein